MSKIHVNLYKIMCGANEEGTIHLCEKCAKDEHFNNGFRHLEKVGFDPDVTVCDDCGKEHGQQD